MTRVKICGIRNKTHALAAVEAGADFIGLVLAPSPRQVNLAQVQKIVTAVKEYSKTIQVVGVFVNMPAAVVNKSAHYCNLDWVQLSGDEPWDYCQQIEKPIIKVIRIKPGQEPQQICDCLANGAKLLSSQQHLYLLDPHDKEKYGGTGAVFDWSLAKQAAKQYQVIIAGGLTPENVTEVIKMIAPWGVDVSSGVEVNGTKDTGKIRAFIEAVRRADEKR